MLVVGVGHGDVEDLVGAHGEDVGGGRAQGWDRDRPRAAQLFDLTTKLTFIPVTGAGRLETRA